MRVMLKDVLPIEHIPKRDHSRSRVSQSVSALISFIERRVGGRFYFETEKIPYGRADLIDLFDLARTLKNAGVITHFSKRSILPDEPRTCAWIAECATKHTDTAGGLSESDDRSALTATLAEALERYLWRVADDHFYAAFTATSREAARYRALSPNEFVGFSNEQRARDARLRLHNEAQYLWVRAHSWTDGKSVYVPAQLVSALHASKKQDKKQEPIIRMPITTGLATWTTREGAVLRGALEVIERDAFMIMWLNQLALPRISWRELRPQNASLDRLLQKCARYRLEATLVSLVTDAPTSVACVIVRDVSAANPPISIGLKAGMSIAHSAEGALLEALRARQSIRNKGNKELPEDPAEIGHTDRLLYWNRRDRHIKLAKLFSEPEIPATPSPWRYDSASEHLERILQWCRAKNYRCVSVDLGRSKKNPTPWKVEIVVMPELQPMHLNEKYQYCDGPRIRSVPEEFGYNARANPFTDEPHPFA